MSSAIDADVREERRDLLARLARSAGTGAAGRSSLQLLALELRDRLALGERLRHRLAVHLGELRLVVERLQVRRAAGHVEVDDALRPRRGSAAAGRRRPRRASVRRRSSRRRVEQRGEGQRAQARAAAAEERAARQALAQRLGGRRSGAPWAHRSGPRDHLVQVQDRPRHRRPAPPARPASRSVAARGAGRPPRAPRPPPGRARYCGAVLAQGARARTRTSAVARRRAAAPARRPSARGPRSSCRPRAGCARRRRARPRRRSGR